MSNDERAQDVSVEESGGEADTAQINAAPEPAPWTVPGRWAAITVPARRHPVGLAIGSAAAGLVLGLLGGLAVDAHPMMSLTVGTAAVPAAVDRPDPGGPPPGPPGERGGPAFDGPQGPPQPPWARGPHHPGIEGPGGAMGPGGPPPAPGDGPRGPGIEGPDGGPGPGQRPPTPPNGGPSPTAPGAPQPTNPGGDAPQSPPLPAERGGAPQA